MFVVEKSEILKSSRSGSLQGGRNRFRRPPRNRYTARTSTRAQRANGSSRGSGNRARLSSTEKRRVKQTSFQAHFLLLSSSNQARCTCAEKQPVSVTGKAKKRKKRTFKGTG